MRCFIAVLIIAGCFVLPVAAQPAGTTGDGQARPNWWTEISRFWPDGGDETIARDDLDEAAKQILAAEVPGQPVVMAAAVSAEGHWTFVNRSGQRFTAANTQEMAAVASNLAPNTDGTPAAMIIHVAGNGVFRHPEHLDLLPERARLRLVAEGASFPLRRTGTGGRRRWLAEVIPNLLVPATDRESLREAVGLLRRPLTSRRVRILALTPGGPAALAPRLPNAAGAAAPIEQIDPLHLPAAMRALTGQTAVVIGRIERQSLLTFRTANGREQSISYEEARAAAQAADADFVVVSSAAPRQPGARNWLWLRVEVEGLADALRRDRYGTFIAALANSARPLLAEIRSRGADRVTVTVLPAEDGAGVPAPGPLGSVVSEVYSEVAGTVVTHGVVADVSSRARQRELERRMVPGIPADLQMLFGAVLMIGLAGLPVAWRWWGLIWAAERRSDYAGERGYWSAKAVRVMAFAGLFLPIAGLPAAIWLLLSFAGRLFARSSRSAAPS